MERGAWRKFTNQKQWEAYLKMLVKADLEFAKRALIVVYKNQLPEEQYTGHVYETNKKGFNKVESERMTEIAVKVENEMQLTKGECAELQNRIGKYWKQLMVYAKKEQAAKLEEQKIRDNIQKMLKQNEHKVKDHLEFLDNLWHLEERREEEC